MGGAAGGAPSASFLHPPPLVVCVCVFVTHTVPGRRRRHAKQPSSSHANAWLSLGCCSTCPPPLPCARSPTSLSPGGTQGGGPGRASPASRCPANSLERFPALNVIPGGSAHPDCPAHLASQRPTCRQTDWFGLSLSAPPQLHTLRHRMPCRAPVQPPASGCPLKD